VRAQDDHNKPFVEVAVIKLSKKQGAMIALSALVAGLAVGCASETKTNNGGSVAAEDTGTLGLNLTLSNGVVINAFTATITGAGLASPVVRTIPVPNDGATVSALFGGLPAGAYAINIAGTSVDGHSQCGGSANFTVIAQQTVGVSVPITCNTDSIRGRVTVNGDLNVCPDVDFLFVAPLQTAVGGPISVEAHASDSDAGDVVSYVWSATGGTFVSTTAASTTYTCSAPGTQTLTVTINDGGSCTTMHQQQVFCQATAVCGDGVVETDKGEQCDNPAGTVANPVVPNGVICSATCQNVAISCGNSIVQPGEQCDPPSAAASCDTGCQNIVCGDGQTEGNELCDSPANTGTAYGQCLPGCAGIVPAVCGNGIVEGPEDCDDNTAACVGCQIDNVAACNSCLTNFCAGQQATVAQRCVGTDAPKCATYLACQETSGCAEGTSSTADSRDCYCGDGFNIDVCFSPDQETFDPALQAGACNDEAQLLAGTAATAPLTIGTRWFDTTRAIGAIGQLNLCTANNCASVCY
jgi:hypothetical protein